MNRKKEENNTSEEYKKKDFQTGVLHYNTMFQTNYKEKDFTFEEIEYMRPCKLFEGYFEPYEEEGWLDALYGSDEWIEQMEMHEKRSFKNVIANYLNGINAPAIIIENMVCDGYGRIIFFHVIGKKVPVAKFKLKKIK